MYDALASDPFPRVGALCDKITSGNRGDFGVR